MRGAQSAGSTGDVQTEHLSGDAAVLVEVVHVEGPVEFVSDGASQEDGQTHSKVLQRPKEEERPSSQPLPPNLRRFLLRNAQITSKLTDPLLCVSKASNRKWAYMLESENNQSKFMRRSYFVSQSSTLFSFSQLKTT